MSYDFSVRRIITGHDDGGNAIIVEDAAIPAEQRHVELAAGANVIYSAEIWGTSQMPPSNEPPFLAVQKAGGRALPPGAAGQRTMLRIVALPPHSASPMHRTETLDYGILLEGECDLLLDSGERVNCGPGDIVVQRGTIHSWINAADAPCRWAWVLIDSPPVEVNGARMSHEWRPARASEHRGKLR